MKIQKNVKLADYTTFHIGGKAKYFAEIRNVEELKEAADFAKKNKLKIFVLGVGKYYPYIQIRNLCLLMF